MKLIVIFITVIWMGLLATGTHCANCDATRLGTQTDGKTDQSAVIQKALDSLGKKGGGTVFLPTGRYRLDHGITIPTGVTLSGIWKTPHHSQQVGGTALLAYAGKGDEDAAPLVSLEPSSAITGVTIFYPEQSIPPIHYPWTIRGRGNHCSVENVTLVNPYKGINFGTYANELHYVRNVFGCPLRIGVHIDKTTDIGRVENVHFNPHYWMRSGEQDLQSWDKLSDYLYNNCIAFNIASSDWEMFTNTFCFGAKVGYRFTDNAIRERGCNGSFVGIAADSTDRAILVEDCLKSGLLITNGQFVAKRGAAAVLEVLPCNKGVVQLSNCSFWGFYDRVARIDGSGSVSLNQCNFQNWDNGKKGLHAIEAYGGDLIVQSCQFQAPRKQIYLGKNLKTAVIQGNRFTGLQQIDNDSSGDVQIGLNAVRK